MSFKKQWRLVTRGAELTFSTQFLLAWIPSSLIVRGPEGISTENVLNLEISVEGDKSYLGLTPYPFLGWVSGQVSRQIKAAAREVTQMYVILAKYQF